MILFIYLSFSNHILFLGTSSVTFQNNEKMIGVLIFICLFIYLLATTLTVIFSVDRSNGT